MGLETGTFISDLNEANPVGASDDIGFGDDHLRLIKKTQKNSFPGQNFPVAFVVGGGSANAYTGTITSPTTLTGYINGMEVKLVIPAENTSSSTLNLNSLGAKSIKNPDGSNVVAKQLLLNSIVHLIFSSTLDAFILIGGGAAPIVTNPGEVYFKYISTTQCRLIPFNGNRLMVKTSGTWQARVVPSSGINLSNGGLSASTRYYVYCYDNAGVLTLEGSTTGHATDTDTGVEIKSGDATRTLVGMVTMDASGLFKFTINVKLVISWYNRRPVALVGIMDVQWDTSSGPWFWVGSNGYIHCVTFGDEAIEAHATISGLTLSAGAVVVYAAIGLNSGTAPASGVIPAVQYTDDPSSGYYRHASSPGALDAGYGFVEGTHILYALSGCGIGSIRFVAGYCGIKGSLNM